MSVAKTTARAVSRLRLASRLQEEIEALAAAGYPNEACGLLVGREVRGTVYVEHVRTARNLNRKRARDRYALDPFDFLRAEHFAAENGLDIVGIWHSHPDHAAIPSQTDLDAAWSGYSYVIVSVVGGRALESRSWRLDGDEFVEEAVEA